MSNPNLKPSFFFDLSKYKHARLFENCTYVWQALKNIETYLAQNIPATTKLKVPKGVYLENADQIIIGKGTIIEPGAFIRGPCIIGENCSIRHGAYIRGNVIIGDRCVVGHTTEVKGSIFLDDSHAAHFNYVGDSILGNHVNLGAGTKCANLKLDNGEILIYVDGKSIATGMRKFGAIIGDHSQLGCNSVSNPGTLIGQHVFCCPCLSIGGVIPSNSIIKPSEKATIAPYTKNIKVCK